MISVTTLGHWMEWIILILFIACSLFVGAVDGKAKAHVSLVGIVTGIALCVILYTSDVGLA